MRLLASLLLVSTAVLANGIHVSDATTPQPPVRLTLHRVQAKIEDRTARVTVRQTFLNTTAGILEGTYLFPLPRNAVVSGFAMTMGGRMVKGEVLDAEQARAIYLAIVRRQRDPGLLEYCGRNLYRARVFPIPARGRIEIELTYDQLLPADAGAIEFQYPLASDRFNHAPVEQLVIDVEYKGTLALRSVYSPSHPVAVDRRDDGGARISFEQSRTRPQRNLQLFFSRSSRDVGLAVLSHRAGKERGTLLAMLGFDARIEPQKLTPREMVYVLDTSGSMGGEKLEQAKHALAEAIGMLRPQDRFTMIGFATESRLFRRQLVSASAENKRAAGRWIRAREAAGGTALADALDAAVRLTRDGSLPIVVLLTDGRPTIGAVNAPQILNRIRTANTGSARIFTFGIGADLDVKLLDRIAEATRGQRDYIAPHEEIGVVTNRFFRRIDQPVAQDVVLEASDGIEDIYPRRIGDLFADDQIVLLGRYRKSGPATLVLRGKRNGEPFERKFEVKLTDKAGNGALPRIWAQRKVAYLLDHIRLHGENKELVDEVKRLALRHAFVTPYTANLVVEPGHSPMHFTSRGGSFRGPSGGVPPGLRDASGPTTPGTPMDTSKALKKAKDARRAETGVSVRVVNGRTFRFTTRKRWVDSEWDGKTEPKRIEAFSERYFEMLDTHPGLARVLALGSHVLFLLDGKVYEVHPAAPG